MSNNRRDFIKKFGTATGAGFLAATPIASIAETINNREMDEIIAKVTYSGIAQTQIKHEHRPGSFPAGFSPLSS